MDDYHKFYDAHEAYIEEWHMNQSPNYFSITKGQLVALTPTPLTTIMGVSAGSSTFGSNGGGPTIRAWVLPVVNTITEFLKELCTNYQGVKTNKLCTLQEFQRQPHESLWEVYTWM